MATFGEWVKATRGADTQVACAARAGMTPQQWNQIEKQVRQPEQETVKRVASGLRVPDEEALIAAGYDAPGGFSSHLARQIEAYLMRIPPNRRPQAERFLVDQARQVTELLAV